MSEKKTILKYLDGLKEKHESYPRNKLIARTLYKLGYIERCGNGTLKIFDECREHGIPSPILKNIPVGYPYNLFLKNRLDRV